MDIKSLNWSQDLCDFFGIHMSCLPTIKSSSEIYGYVSYEGCPLPSNIPFGGCLGDQQAALVGQKCFKPGMAKNTYGTGCFMLYNVGPEVVFSNHGLLSTVAYQLGANEPPTYALEWVRFFCNWHRREIINTLIFMQEKLSRLLSENYNFHKSDSICFQMISFFATFKKYVLSLTDKIR